MSDARAVADLRLAKGEITADEHAKIVSAVGASQPDIVPKSTESAIPEPSKLSWGLTLAGSFGGALFVKTVADELISEGRSVNWTFVNLIYFFCAVSIITAVYQLAKKND